MSKTDDNEIKVILVGESGTGKTSLINVAVGLSFNPDIVTTSSSTYVQKSFQISGKEYKLNLWDTIGQEKYRALTKIFIKDSKIVIFVYDITKKKTFDELEFWIKTIEEILGKEAVIGIVGNKSDLYLKEDVKEEIASNYAKSKGAFFKTTSAKADPLSFIKFLEILLKEYLKKNKDNLNGTNKKGKELKNKNVNSDKGCC